MKFDRIIEIARAMHHPDEHTLRTFHLSAIIFKNKILALGLNTAKTHTVNLKNPKMSHDGQVNIKAMGGSCSELKACLALKNRVGLNSRRCTLINIRLLKDGRVANSRPCASCASLLKYFNFKKVYFSNDVGVFEEYE